ncbi:MAG: GTP-binding protein [Bacteroidetes bacterium]|jgi:small GTP-binding protein|nr:GTP-binding protein [Bacteroidota bacterium]
MLQKKICLLGASAVGKTSLIRRFVHGTFSEKYLTTIGVKIDKKTVEVGAATVDLLVWDIYGEDRFQTVSTRYLRGASGYLLVADGTRRQTLDEAHALHERAQDALGPVPYLLLLNKADLEQAWTITEDQVATLGEQGWTVLRTSAKTGTGVDDAFTTLAARLV